MPAPNHYELLGLTQSASQDDVKAAYRREALRNHPDQGGNSAVFRMIEDAYATLISPTLRAEYDEALYRDHRPLEQPSTASATWGTFMVMPRARWRPFRFGFTIPWRAVIFALAIWILVAMVTDLPVIPGVNDSGAVWVIAWFVTMWFFGSLALRLGGIVLAIFALSDAYWNGAGPAVTAVRLVLAFTIWLAGQWFFVWRHGHWHSMIAEGILTKLPPLLRPDRRWQNKTA